MSYFSEGRTESLVLCSGLQGLHQHKLNQTHSSKPALAPHSLMLPRNKLSILLNYDHLDLPGNRRAFPKPKLPFDQLKPGLQHSTNDPHLVKVTVYTKAVNPYIVIYDSTQKYAQPTAYLKLAHYSALPGNGKDDDDCAFRILPNRHEDLDNASVITFRALTKEKRDDWVQYLSALCGGNGLPSAPVPGYVPGSSVLPTLVEENDDEVFSTETFKIPTPHKRRNGRRSSLNSLGIRLRINSGSLGRAR